MDNSLFQFISRVLKKKWSSSDIHNMVGNFEKCYFAYASDEKYRKKAASGGCITAILAWLLSTGRIDGALVCKGEVTAEGKFRPQFIIATSENELLQAQGSKYSAVNFGSQAVPMIRSFSGRLAVVALPCDLAILSRLCSSHQEINKKIVVKIALFCGHNSEARLTDRIIDSIRPGDRKLIGFRHRLGRWRGYLQADFEEGHRITKPFSYFSDYQNLYFFCQKKCHYCHNHTGYDADISCGDIWSARMENEPIKHSALIARNQTGLEVILQARDAGWLTTSEEPIEEVCDGQARTMPFHYNVTARSRMAFLTGDKIIDSVHAKVRIVDYLVAGMVLLNEKLSRKKSFEPFLFKLPGIVVKLYLYTMKVLESL